MNSKHRTAYVIFFQTLLCLVLFIMQYQVFPVLKVGNAYPSLLLSFVVLSGFFFGFSNGAVWGLISGLLIDSVTNGSTCFYTILLLLVGLITGLLATYYLNTNFRAVLSLNLIWSLIFFISKWLVFVVFAGTGQYAQYLFEFALPSCIYTCLIFLPIYFIFKLLKKHSAIKQ